MGGGIAMKFSLYQRSRSAFIPLRDAVLCLDCQFITQPNSELCSVCGGHLLAGVAQILGALLEEPPATAPASRPAGRMQRHLQLIYSADHANAREVQAGSE